MNNHITFVSWLEGFLDATKNNLTAPQVREIRKKINEVKQNSSKLPQPFWESNLSLESSIPSLGDTDENNLEVNDEFLKEIERRKNASTMEELDA